MPPHRNNNIDDIEEIINIDEIRPSEITELCNKFKLNIDIPPNC
jgi:hypothetical protein